MTRRRLKQLLTKYKQSERRYIGYLGNYERVVDVSGRTNYVYARIPGQKGEVREVYNNKVPSIYNLKVVIVHSKVAPHILEVDGIWAGGSATGGRPSDSGNPDNTPPPLVAHASSHQWMHPSGGTDVIYSHLRQLLPFRATPDGMSINIHRSVGYVADNLIYSSGTSLDLSGYTETVSGTTQYALIYVNENGVPNFTINSGSATTFDDIGFDDVPAPPTGSFPVAAVRLYNSQSSIQENRLYTDIIDLRYPPWHDHEFLSLRDTFPHYTGTASSLLEIKPDETGIGFTSFTQDEVVLLNGSRDFTGNQSMGGNDFTDINHITFVTGTAITLTDPGVFTYNDGVFTVITEKDQHQLITSGNTEISDTKVENTIVETSIYSNTISANEFHIGELVRCVVAGYYSTVNASDTFDITFKIGGTTILTKTSVAENVTDGPWKCEFIFTVRSLGASGTVMPFLSANFNNTNDDQSPTSVSTINTTLSCDVTVTITWSAADVGNTITLTQGYCEFIN